MAKPFLTPEELSERWSLPLTTLSQWRWTGKGPEFSKMGKRVRYSVEDVEHFEEQVVRKNTCNSQVGLYPNIALNF
jgi:predicted site-specific integrase-resolvase